MGRTLESLRAVLRLELQLRHLEELVARRNRGRTSVYILYVLLLLSVLRNELLVHVVRIWVQEELVAVTRQRSVEAAQLVLGLAELLCHLLLAHRRQEARRRGRSLFSIEIYIGRRFDLLHYFIKFIF